VNKWRDFLTEAQECLKEECPGCEKCLGEGVGMGALGAAGGAALGGPVGAALGGAAGAAANRDEDHEEYMGDETVKPFDTELDDFREMLYDLSQEVVIHYQEKGAPREAARELVGDVLRGAVENFLEDLHHDSLEDVLNVQYEEEGDLLEEGELEVSSHAQVEKLHDIEEILKDIHLKLDSIDDLDASVDYLAAALTGERPAVAQAKQASVGRLAAPPTAVTPVTRGEEK